MNLKDFLFTKNPPGSLLPNDYEELKEKYLEALKFYCPECQRGFDKKAGKNMHDRWVHLGNPPIPQNK